MIDLVELTEKADIQIVRVVSVSVVIAVTLFALDFLATDAANHMHFADHYAQNWFSLYDYQTGGGLDISTYPPLAYQMIALGSLVLPLKASYGLVLIVFWVILSFFASRFFTEYLELERDAQWLIYLFVFGGVGMLKSIFVHGQMTAVVGLGFGFASLYFLNRGIDTGKLRDLLLSSISYSLVAFSHHFSFVLIGLILALLMLSRYYEVLNKTFIQRFAISSGFAAFVSALGLLPFLKSFLTNSAASAQEIPHYSRTSLLNMTPIQIKSTFFLTYGLSGLMILFPAYLGFFDKQNRDRYLKLYGIGMVFLLGLGHTTPIPQLIFGGWADWITYDRFALMASIIFTGLLAAVTYRVIENQSYIDWSKYLSASAAAAFMLVNILGLVQAHDIAYGDPIHSSEPFKDEITDYTLSQLESKSTDYRYQTFGYGEPIARLYLNTDVPTLDTWYFTGRQEEWIRSSGVEAIDSASEEFTLEFIEHATDESVKYVFTLEPNYHNILESYNWERVEVKRFGDRKVVLWENPENVSEVKNKEQERSVSSYLWGILPISALILFVFLGSRSLTKDFSQIFQFI